jgi:hypothetical protein
MRHPNPFKRSELLMHHNGATSQTPESLKTTFVLCKFKFHKHRMCHNADNRNMNFRHRGTLLQSQPQTLLYASKPYWNIYLKSMKLMSIKRGLYRLSHTIILPSTVPHYCSFMTVILLMQLPTDYQCCLTSSLNIWKWLFELNTRMKYNNFFWFNSTLTVIGRWNTL